MDEHYVSRASRNVRNASWRLSVMRRIRRGARWRFIREQSRRLENRGQHVDELRHAETEDQPYADPECLEMPSQEDTDASKQTGTNDDQTKTKCESLENFAGGTAFQSALRLLGHIVGCDISPLSHIRGHGSLA